MPYNSYFSLDLEHPYEQCGHINVLKKLVSDFDEENDISPDSALERGSTPFLFMGQYYRLTRL